MPANNVRVAKPPEIHETAFVPVADPAQLAKLLCVEEERVVSRDNIVLAKRPGHQAQHCVRTPLRRTRTEVSAVSSSLHRVNCPVWLCMWQDNQKSKSKGRYLTERPTFTNFGPSLRRTRHVDRVAGDIPR